MKKYIFITGGVVSGLGKGIAAASLGLILKSRGLHVVNQKFDPYLNIDPGTLDPYEHGEVFVTDDGAETDLDLGHYERFTDVTLSKSSSTSAGRVYLSVLNTEREGGFKGRTVQVIPNITNEIKRRMLLSSKETNADVIITEIGGTVGDIESLPFVEAIREIKYDVGIENCCYIHLTLMPFIKKANELKTKPTQHSVKDLQGLGIQPNVIMLRSDKEIDAITREKLALFCNVPYEAIIQNLHAKSIYEVPLMMEKERLGTAVCEALGIPEKPSQLENWAAMVKSLYNPQYTVTIALIGKYIELPDAYLSVIESLNHAGIYHKSEIRIDWIDAQTLTTKEKTAERLQDADGIIIPGGFGPQGIEGMILACEYARTKQVAYFGICLGMQICIIEYARNVLMLENANSTEFDKNTPYPVISHRKNETDTSLNGRFRLGSYECKLKKNSLAHKAYAQETIAERHRNNWECNNEYYESFEKTNLHCSGINPTLKLVEIVELESPSTHPWMCAVQFHPEFKSRPNKPHPLFCAFIGASLKHL